jgi:hypothetical protein
VENSSTKYEYEKVWLAPDVGPIIYRDYTENWSSVTYSQELQCFSSFDDLLCGGMPGDTDGDGRLNLADVIYGLQVLSGIRK